MATEKTLFLWKADTATEEFEPVEPSAEQRRTFQALCDIENEFDAGQGVEAHAKLDRFDSDNPGFAFQTDEIRFKWMASEDPMAFSLKIDTILSTEGKDHWCRLGALCGQLATLPETTDLAILTIEKVLALSKHEDLFVLYFATVTYVQAGEISKANTVSAEAISLIDSNPTVENEPLRGFFSSIWD